jgi:hypothetical protein
MSRGFIVDIGFKLLAGQIYFFILGNGDLNNFQPVLAAQIAVAFTADILAWRNIWQINLELTLLLKNPNGALLNLLFDDSLLGALRGFDNHA